MSSSSSSSPPKPSVSLPLTSRGAASPVLPTPSNSTSVRTLPTTTTTAALSTSKLVELEHQLAEKEKQLQESSGGIEKNVLVRQIRQLQDKIQLLTTNKRQEQESSTNSSLSTTDPSYSISSSFHQNQLPDKSTSTSSFTSSSSTSNSNNGDRDQLAPETMEKLRYLERDLNSYRTSLIPGVSRKEKLLSQRSNALNPLPSPSSSSMQESSSASLLPLPPSLAGATPTKRRSKVPNNDRRNTDIEFATEIGQGLLLEVRKMQALLQEKEEQLRALELQRSDLERSIEVMAKQLRQRDEAEERLKEETWNLELAKQELTMTVTELQQHLSKANAEQTKLNRQIATVTSELEQVRGREDKLTAAIETLKTRHEQDMTGVRRHMATIQREKAEQSKQLEVMSSELAIAKAQTRIAKRSHQDLTDINKSISNKTGINASLDGTGSNDGDDDTSQLQQFQQQQQQQHSSNKSNIALSPSSSSATTMRQQQAMEVETLKTSLGHAHRMVSTLRSNLHKEKTEKFELKKLLAESQETIEQMQNDPRMWEDTGLANTDAATTTIHSSANANNHNALDSTGTTSRRPRRSRRRSHARMAPTSSRSNSIHVKDQQDDEEHDGNRSRSTRVAFDDDDYSYSSFTSDDDDNDHDDERKHSTTKSSSPVSSITTTTITSPPGFTSLSMELSKSQQQQESSPMSRSNSGGLASLSEELAKHMNFQPSPSSSTEQPKVHRSLGDELTFADAFRQAASSTHNTDDQQQADLLKSDAFQDILKGAAFGAAGSGLVGAIAQARAHRGVDVTTQTIASTPVETKDTDIQTDKVVVSLPVETKDTDIQTDKVVVSLPVEAKDTDIQTDDVVVSLPVEHKHVDIQTNDVVIFLPTEHKDMEMQTDDVMIYQPVEHVHSDMQTDDVAIYPCTDHVDNDVQTNEVIVSLPVELKDVEIQTNEKPASVDKHIQSNIIITGVDQEIQMDPVTSIDQASQYLAPVAPLDQSTQYDYQVSEVHVGVQSDIIPPAVLEEKAVQTTNVIDNTLVAPSLMTTHDDTDNHPINKNGDNNDKVEKMKQQSSPVKPSGTLAGLLATGAAALGFGGAIAHDRDDDDDGKVDDLKKEGKRDTKEDTKPDEVTSSGDSTSTEKVIDSKNLTASGRNNNNVKDLAQIDEDNNIKDLTSGIADKSTTSENVEQATEEKTLSRSEADAMVAAAVAAALKKQQQSEVSPTQTDTISTNTIPESAIKRFEIGNDKRHTCDMSANGGPTIEDDNYSRTEKSVLDGTTRDSTDSRRSESTEATTVSSADGNFSSQTESSSIPARPTSPPPPALLARSSLLRSNGGNDRSLYDKGKWPMIHGNNNTSSSPSNRQIQQMHGNHSDSSGLSTPMARVNPNYYNKEDDTDGTAEGKDSVASTASLSTSQQRQQQQQKHHLSSEQSRSMRSSSTSLADPTISLITDTMMGHWLWKYPRHQRLLRNPPAQPHQRYFWMHPYTRTLYWSTHAPGIPNRDVRTKSAYIENMKVIQSSNEGTGLPNASIQIKTSEGDMKLVAPDTNTHQTWVESLSYVLARQPDVNRTNRMMRPTASSSRTTSRFDVNSNNTDKRHRSSMLSDFFHSNNGSTLSTPKPKNKHQQRHSIHDWPSGSIAQQEDHHKDISKQGELNDDELEQLEDLRMCCNGKHHLSHLERDRILPSRPRYPKRSFRHSLAATGY